MRKISVIFFMAITHSVFSQQTSIDSLNKLIVFSQEDTATVMRYYDIGQAYAEQMKEDSAIIYFNKASSLSQKIKWEPGNAWSKFGMSVYYFNKNNYPKAISHVLQSLVKFENLKDTFGIQSSLQFAGILYRIAKDYIRSIQYCKRAYFLAKLLNNGQLAWRASWNIATGFSELNIPDSAIIYFQECYQIAIQSQGSEKNANMGWTFQGLARTHHLFKDDEIALSYLYKGLTYANKANNRWLFSDIFETFSQVFKEIGKFDSSIKYSQLSIAANPDNMNFLLPSYKQLADIYESRNNDSAVKYFKLSSEIMDSLFNARNKTEIDNLTSDEEDRQKALLIKEKIDIEQRKHNIQYIAIALGLVTFLILFLIFSRSIIANQRLIKFLGVLALLIVFEFINLYIHPFLAHTTDDSPLLMLLVMVCIAALLVPAHHRIEKWVTQRLVEKNNKIRLAAAKRTIASLEGE